MAIDWRLPGNRREAFQRQYSLHLKYNTHPGCVYFALPAIADAYDLDYDQRAWLTWLNGNTQNPAMSLLLLEAAPRPESWDKAVDFWNENFKLMEWDTDRRHQKSKFGEATEKWWAGVEESPAADWLAAGEGGWETLWRYARSQPYMGRLSAWSMSEYARLLLGTDLIPDADDLMLRDKKGSASHRNGLAVVSGRDATYWAWEDYTDDVVDELETLSWDLLAEARSRNPGNPYVGLLTMESALCTYKSWHKPGRRYPNVYADMMYYRLHKAESRFGDRFQVLWEARSTALPDYLRLEASPHDPGLVAEKQNLYLETGVPPMLHREWPDMENHLNHEIDFGLRPERTQ